MAEAEIELRTLNDRMRDADALPSDIRGYHRRTKHAPTRYALGPAFLDWTSQPSPFRRFDGAPRIELPLRDREETAPFPGPALRPALLDRMALGLFLELGFGLSAWKSYEGSTWALRNNPSSGNLHPTETYLLANAAEGLGETAALYHYAQEDHALERRAGFETPVVLPEGGFLLGLSSIPWRESWKYGERAFRYCQLDVGHAIGAAAQAAAALGWRAHLLCEPGDADIAALLGLDRPDASHRREEEHPDALLWIAADGNAPPAIDVSNLARASRTWTGAANRLSEDHDGWPLVDMAARLCVKSRTPTMERAAQIAPKPAFPFPLPDIGRVVRRRRSAQRMDGVARLSQEAFRAMLTSTLPGAEPCMAPFPWPPRLNLLLFVHRVESVEPGLYLLQRDADTTARLREMSALALLWTPIEIGPLKLFRLRQGAVEREASMNACRQAIAGKGCFAVAMIADFDRTLQEDGGFGYRRLHWEAGAIGQALYLWASATGLSGTGIGCFFDDEIHAMLGLSPEQYAFQDVYHFTVGAALEDQRMLTLPAYPEEMRERT
ncbi:SagB/ThcOx family dehydrogenase [Methylocystis sp. SC2]|uniref:SagB/ThcOx family dehydrogenase n=1 Tax=Methylocystis sp. (strain SC2) TaxID=187303 RepID=UPI00027AECCE|nr:SagB/ThcOx family dehydrogenase [Methylocystis sp. SC2]CCJ08136.1 Nitroreductase-like protein [Methylocystis sp. SC2]